METSAISYRVADFLKQHPPFQAMDESDLLELAARGRVKFHEPNEYILWQGEPHRHQVFVIQQGTVSLWDETTPEAQLRDVRGAGDLLAIERFNGAEACLHSARSSSDVLIYAFPASEFETLLYKYPAAGQFVAGYGSVVADYEWADTRRNPQSSFLHEVVAFTPFVTCGGDASIAQVARSLMAGGEAVAVVEPAGGVRALLTATAVLGWVAAGAGDAAAAVDGLLDSQPPVTLAPDASVTDAVLTMAEADARALAITADGTPGGTLHAVVSVRDLAPVFGDHPLFILRDIREATTVEALQSLNQRARAFALHQLTGAGSVEWVARFLHLADVALVRRLIAWGGAETDGACWCLCGAAGRAESLTRAAPSVVLVLADETGRHRGMAACRQVVELLGRCGYLAHTDAPFEASFYAASRAEWQRRYERWISDPVGAETYRARPLFDLRPIQGARDLWQTLETAIATAVGRDFVRVLANDCLASSPPLTFFRDAVVDGSGEESSVFRLERTALLPLVDVGRVFGLATRRVSGTSTLERFASASTVLPEHRTIFREASDALRIVLWLQGRVGIAQGTDGAELPPALVSRHDRHLLRSGFRSIHQLLELTASWSWLEAL
jgi:CBS domain-containing protein